MCTLSESTYRKTKHLIGLDTIWVLTTQGVFVFVKTLLSFTPLQHSLLRGGACCWLQREAHFSKWGLSASPKGELAKEAWRERERVSCPSALDGSLHFEERWDSCLIFNSTKMTLFSKSPRFWGPARRQGDTHAIMHAHIQARTHTFRHAHTHTYYRLNLLMFSPYFHRHSCSSAFVQTV